MPERQISKLGWSPLYLGVVILAGCANPKQKVLASDRPDATNTLLRDFFGPEEPPQE
jgi:hypothetical protein